MVYYTMFFWKTWYSGAASEKTWYFKTWYSHQVAQDRMSNSLPRRRRPKKYGFVDMKRGEAAVLEWKTREFSDVKAAEDVLQASRFFITRLQLAQMFACGAVRCQSFNLSIIIFSNHN